MLTVGGKKHKQHKSYNGLNFFFVNEIGHMDDAWVGAASSAYHVPMIRDFVLSALTTIEK